ncbi:SMC-Scp complex subunit ScpB [Montanilutibacter psychrotolerans]|uniref:SMC-Scp complex subunit ScpB n=1 Tax=Montanilutibacter psychrotolerans TaxID=1327343 RepID=A0A3M8SPB1_9GAMM|nr:SMC-Scp complex subunit ScpB [Lysobacter psychrotolerans]RNF83157.1 SMC-Scp complex subunit ScpB [Lysobacter psychrotolerans]
MEQTFVTRIVEAALLAANQPLTLAQLQGLFPEDQPAPAGTVEHAIEALREGCAERGVELVETASGFRFQVQADVHPWVARLWTDRQTRYTRATLETLALIAYRQPITRGEIEQVRGVAVNSNIIKALEEREWIRVVGHRDVPGKPALFGTTKVFLDYFGLKRLDELPPLSELKEIGELDPQLPFDGATAKVAPIQAGGLGLGDQSSNDDADDTSGRPVIDGDEATGETPDTTPADSGTTDTTDIDAERDEGADTAPDATGDDRDTAPEPADGSAVEGKPEAAPGERAADENDHEQDNAVETTTVPEFEAGSEQDLPEPQK